MTVFQNGKSGGDVNITGGGGISDEQLANALSSSNSNLVESLGAVLVDKLKDVVKGLPAGGGQQAAQEEWVSEDGMKRLADAMVSQRGTNETNFESLGKVKETKKDSGEVKKTIDLLSGLED